MGKKSRELMTGKTEEERCQHARSIPSRIRRRLQDWQLKGKTRSKGANVNRGGFPNVFGELPKMDSKGDVLMNSTDKKESDNLV